MRINKFTVSFEEGDMYFLKKYGLFKATSMVKKHYKKYDVPFDLISKLMISVDNSKFYTRSSVSAKNVERILNEGWLHFEAIREGLKHED